MLQIQRPNYIIDLLSFQIQFVIENNYYRHLQLERNSSAWINSYIKYRCTISFLTVFKKRYLSIFYKQWIFLDH